MGFTLEDLEEFVKSARDKGFDNKDIIYVTRGVITNPVGKVTDAYVSNEKLYIEYGSL